MRLRWTRLQFGLGAIELSPWPNDDVLSLFLGSSGPVTPHIILHLSFVFVINSRREKFCANAENPVVISVLDDFPIFAFVGADSSSETYSSDCCFVLVADPYSIDVETRQDCDEKASKKPLSRAHCVHSRLRSHAKLRPLINRIWLQSFESW